MHMKIVFIATLCWSERPFPTKWARKAQDHQARHVKSTKFIRLKFAQFSYFFGYLWNYQTVELDTSILLTTWLKPSSQSWRKLATREKKHLRILLFFIVILCSLPQVAVGTAEASEGQREKTETGPRNGQQISLRRPGGREGLHRSCRWAN